MYLLGLGHAATHWVAGTFYVLLPFMTKDLGLSYTQAGLLVSILHISSFFANFGSGAVVDVTGRKVIFQVISLGVGGVALLVFGFTGLYMVPRQQFHSFPTAIRKTGDMLCPFMRPAPAWAIWWRRWRPERRSRGGRGRGRQSRIPCRYLS